MVVNDSFRGKTPVYYHEIGLPKQWINNRLLARALAELSVRRVARHHAQIHQMQLDIEEEEKRDNEAYEQKYEHKRGNATRRGVGHEKWLQI